MVRRNPSSRKPPVNYQSDPSSDRRGVDFDIQQELARLQEMIYESFHIPLTRWTMIDEGKLLDQLDMIGDRIPEAIRKALAILEQEQQILAEAEAYAQRKVQSAQQQAAQILDESGIIQQAQREANQIKQQAQQECSALQEQTITELDQLRQVTNQEIQQLRQQSLVDYQNIQEGADEYADAILTRLEQQLGEMLGVVRNGRQQLYNSSSAQNTHHTGKKSSNSTNQRSQ